MKYLSHLFILAILLLTFRCSQASQSLKTVQVGAEIFEEYLPLLEGMKVALLVNQTSKIGKTHLLDTLISMKVNVVKVFAPEHGFRGNKANGEVVNNEIDHKTGIPIVSLYGKNKKPTNDQLADVDVLVYDIQDVGARFYTYISAMHYMMDACAENTTKMIILDRPNPNGHYVDGPVLELEHQSYVGMHAVPIVYGMTAGEFAQMIIGEQWLTSSKKLDLTVVKVNNWNRKSIYELPIAPSPNLPNTQSIALYPSLCLFEGTNVSVGRGTDYPFQVIGVPDSSAGDYSFQPISKPGFSKYPKYENEICFGEDLRNIQQPNRIDLHYLIRFYNLSKDKDSFFNSFFTKLAGTEILQAQIIEGMSEEAIRATWENDLSVFKKKRALYLIYD